ncbi:MAG: hypothetical protein RLO17_07910, partial [Cyclobacteriaceae bacterium]
ETEYRRQKSGISRQSKFAKASLDKCSGYSDIVTFRHFDFPTFGCSDFRMFRRFGMGQRAWRKIDLFICLIVHPPHEY